MKRLHLFALLFLIILVLDQALGEYHKSSKEGKKKKKTSDSNEAKKRYDDSSKQYKRERRNGSMTAEHNPLLSPELLKGLWRNHMPVINDIFLWIAKGSPRYLPFFRNAISFFRKTREVPDEIAENDGDSEITEEDETFTPGKETKKHCGEEAKIEKYSKKKKQSEEEACFAKDKKKCGKKYNEYKQKKNVQDELHAETDDENEEQVFVSKGKKKSTKKMETKQKYNGEQKSNTEERRKKCCNAQNDPEIETENEVDVPQIQRQKTPRVQKYIEETEEEEEGGVSELGSVTAEKCYP